MKQMMEGIYVDGWVDDLDDGGMMDRWMDDFDDGWIY